MSARILPRIRLPRPSQLAETSVSGLTNMEANSPKLALPSLGLLKDDAAISKYVWTFVWIGIAARAVRYLLCFPLWEDECFVCYNLIDRGYAELLQPLDYHQVAPVLFLWAQLTMVKLLGFSEWTLRLIPFVCGIASVFLFRRVASQLLSGLSLVCAVGIFAVSYPGIRYAAEAKPYGTDLFCGLVMMAMFINWRQMPDRSRWVWGLAAVAPFAICFSYPAAFVCGGISIGILHSLLRDRQQSKERRQQQWNAWAVLNVATLAAFGATYALAAAQRTAELGFMQSYWGNAFPPLDSVLGFLGWFGVTHASDLLAYPIGGARGASALTLICCLTAIVILMRKRKTDLLLLFAVPLLLNLIAAALHKYPYGGHVKFAQYHAPMICLTAGLGMAIILQAHARWIPSRGRLGVHMACAALVLIAVGSMGRDIVSPFKSTTDMRHRAFAQWFWFNTEFQGETVCMTSDLKVRFSKDTYADLSWSAMYLCNQQIYSPRHRTGTEPDWACVAKDWPLRCVLFRAPRFDFDESAKAAWLSDMQSKYDLVSSVEYPFPCFGKREREAINVDYVEVFTFVPRAAAKTVAAKE